ncbi:hypothetical protein L1887_61393 [Cichorium endivia]|nr:hypothetical protein L1887_61393 [Cichorium endivia]
MTGSCGGAILKRQLRVRMDVQQPAGLCCRLAAVSATVGVLPWPHPTILLLSRELTASPFGLPSPPLHPTFHRSPSPAACRSRHDGHAGPPALARPAYGARLQRRPQQGGRVTQLERRAHLRQRCVGLGARAHARRARQARHGHRLGCAVEPHRNVLAGSQCVRVAAAARHPDWRAGVEADSRSAASQPRRYVRAMEPERGQVCGGLRSEDHQHLLVRGGQRLVGSADMRARVFSAYIKGVDAKPPASVWGERLPFGTVCGEFSTPSGGWIHGVAFSPSGDALAFVGHDSSLTVVYPSGPRTASCCSARDSLTHSAGDAQQGWAIVKSLDAAGAAASKGAPPPPPPKAPGLSGPSVGRLNNEAFNRFKSADSRGGSSSPLPTAAGGGGGSVAGALGAVAGASVGADGELHTTHQNTITSIRPFSGARDNVDHISTSGVDGRLCIFAVAQGTPVGGIQKGLSSLQI